MNKNLIPIIAKMLDVEIEEEFKIKDDDPLIDGDYDYDYKKNIIYKFTETDFLEKDVDEFQGIESWAQSPCTLEALITGHVSIIKLPWKPKIYDTYWTFKAAHINVWRITDARWTNNPNDVAALKEGWVFRTMEEAKAALPKVAAEMNVEYIEEEA